MERYFGDVVTTATTFAILILLVFIGYSVFGREKSKRWHWGRRSAFVLVYGLFVCCLAAARDGLDRTIQNAIDASCASGLFPLVSVPTIIGCIGAAAVIIAAIATPIAKTQSVRRTWFYIMSSAVVLKILVVEIARLVC